MTAILKNAFKITGAVLLTAILSLTSAFFTIVLYAKYTDQKLNTPLFGSEPGASPVVVSSPPAPPAQPQPAPPQVTVKPSAAMLRAPLVKQNPELPSGCELTALTMLLQFYGIQKDKMELLPEMKLDPTPIQRDDHGNIVYWGNPNVGYVGDITGKKKGFGIYHAGLFPLLQSYIPTGIDLTGGTFEQVERQVAAGIPVVVWTTIPFTVPTDDQWVQWDSSLGPVRTTFLEHAVLLIGYDEGHVYLNDPLSGKVNVSVEKEQFVASWVAMGKQSLSYKPAASKASN